MPILKDVYCVRCGTEHEQVLDMDCHGVTSHCEICNRETPHDVVCNGGSRLAPNEKEGYYLNENPYESAYEGISVIDSHGKVHTEADGTRTDAKFNNGFRDRISEKKDKKLFERRKQKGKNKLFAIGTSPIAGKAS